MRCLLCSSAQALLLSTVPSSASRLGWTTAGPSKMVEEAIHLAALRGRREHLLPEMNSEDVRRPDRLFSTVSCETTVTLMMFLVQSMSAISFNVMIIIICLKSYTLKRILDHQIEGGINIKKFLLDANMLFPALVMKPTDGRGRACRKT